LEMSIDGLLGRVHLGGLAHAVAAGAEELVEHVVLVGRDDELADRQAPLLRDEARVDVAEVARGHGEADLLVVARRGLEVAAK
jgi:hypothetical protein